MIMRHGKAEDASAETGWSDRARQLTPEGIEKIRAMIPGMQRLQWAPDHIVSSPYPRAAETASIVREGLGMQRAITFNDDLGADRSVTPFYRDQLGGLLESSECLMVVGHEPILSQLASLLISGRQDARIQLKKGGVIHLRCVVLDHKSHGILAGHWTSRQVRLLA